MRMTALYVKVNGDSTKVSPANGFYFCPFELQKYIGGPIKQQLTRDKKTIISIDEEIVKENINIINKEATNILEQGKVVFGHALICQWDID